MVTSRHTISVIKKIIAKHYNRLILSTLGRPHLSADELKTLQAAGIDTSNPDSLLSLVYYHSFINHPTDAESPKDVEEMKRQQSVTGLRPQGEANEYAIESINDRTKQYIEKLKLDVMTKIESLVRENNDSYKMDAMRNLDRPDMLDELVKESSLGKLQQKLRDSSGEGNRDWLRIALTEMSNAIGAASIDRIVTDNRTANPDEIYVFRIIVQDAKTCKWCRRFYQDDDGSPALYKLSTLMANGSNYGKKTSDWLPVAGATHPWERCSGTLELKPGFALTAGGSPTYIGMDKWPDYISKKLRE